MSGPVRAIQFDVDGTLIDSNDLHAEAWAVTFRQFGFDVPVRKIRGQIGKGGDNLIPALLPPLPEARQKEIAAYRDATYQRDFMGRAKAFPEVCALFARVRDDRRDIVLATSAKDVELEHGLDLIGCRELVTGHTTADDVANSKPDPDIFAAALKVAGVAADEAIAVGDSPFDMEAAGKIGLRALGLRCGGFDDAALREAGAIALFDDPADLLARYGESPLG